MWFSLEQFDLWGIFLNCYHHQVEAKEFWTSRRFLVDCNELTMITFYRCFWMCHWKCVRQGTQRDCTSLHDLERSKVSYWILYKNSSAYWWDMVSKWSSPCWNLSAIQSHNVVVNNFSLEECFSVPKRTSSHFLKLMVWNAFCRFYRNWWSVWTTSKLWGAWGYNGRFCISNRIECAQICTCPWHLILLKETWKKVEQFCTCRISGIEDHSIFSFSFFSRPIPW